MDKKPQTEKSSNMDKDIQTRKEPPRKAGPKFYIIFALITVLVAVGLFSVMVNSRVQEVTKDEIIFDLRDNSASLPKEVRESLMALNPQCIMVLGCAIEDEETPTDMLRDRLDAGIALYNQGVAPKLLLTGDNGQERYNEIHVMYNYCLKAGVPGEDIFCDHAGFSTNESMIRAGEIFNVTSMVVVTQRYHEYRAIYIAEKLGLNVLGVAASQGRYPGQPLREMRELLARNKDFLLFNFGNPAAVGGEKIDITGDGTISHGE